jgi:thiamine biosynthesis lipoprotein
MKLLILLLPIFLSANLLTRTHVAMGTFVSVKLNKDDIKHSKSVFDIFKDIESSISSYDTNSVVYNLNKNKITRLDKYTYEAFEISKELHKQTNSYFDITIGTITKDYFQFGENEFIPYVTLMQNAKVGFNKLTYNQNMAYLRKDVKIDLGGMGKGYAVDKAIGYLKAKGVKSAVVSASGDIRCLSSCIIDINNPNSQKPLVSFKTISKELGISTSGTYNRYVKVKKNNHLINPKSNKPQTAFSSVTLISNIPNAMLDGYATALSVMPKEQLYSFLYNKNIAYIILQSDANLIISDNIDKFVNLLQ